MGRTQGRLAAPRRPFATGPMAGITGLLLIFAWVGGCAPGTPEAGQPAPQAESPAPQPSPSPEPPAPPAIGVHLAALQGNLEAVRQHIAAGSDLDAKDAYGSTPLIVAATFDQPAVAGALLDAGAEPSIGNNEGSTPLHIAAFLGRPDVVEVLLGHGADRYLRNDNGAIAYDLAAGPFEDDRPIYDQLRTGLAAMGFRLDDAEARAARVAIAGRLRPDPTVLAAVDFAPATGGGWPTSTPSAEGLDRRLVAELYHDAATLETIRALLVVKNGRLVAEGYFNGGSAEEPALLQSVTKSYTSALVGLALEQGCFNSLDQPMLDFFPEVVDDIRDPRKRQITVRHMLQMRAGYPWEETDSTLWAAFIAGDYIPLIAATPLNRDPGTRFEYSNVTSHLLATIVARACDTDVRAFAEENLWAPIGAEAGPWTVDPYGVNYGNGELHATARDVARFGLLYLNDGVFDGRRVVPAGWVEASLQPYSSGFTGSGVEAGTVGRYHRDIGYGYQWWSARVGPERFSYAWGHGGQLVILLHDRDMVVVTLADPFYRPIRGDEESWRHEQAIINLVGKFVQSLNGGPGAGP